MKQHRTIYFNDARHYYLFVFEPPMAMEDAWRPIDEVAGTSVTTFSYGVERSDGLFYPSKHGLMFGSDKQPFSEAYEWRTWNNMQSLIARGLDPLRVLIDRSHTQGIEFWASLRMAFYGGMPPEYKLTMPDSWKNDPVLKSGNNIWAAADFAIQEVRDHQFAVLKELAYDYPTDGIELDFIFSAHYFKPEEARKNLPVMTDYIRSISEMVRSRPGKPGVIGARILPTEQMCLDAGLDVRTWLKEGLLDFVIPMWYHPFYLDSNFPFDWVVDAARDTDTSVYGVLNPYYYDETGRRFQTVTHATPAMMRAAAANHYDRGADGLYTWFLKWPLGDAERGILTDIGDPDLLRESNKHYFIFQREASAAASGYDSPLPHVIPHTAVGVPNTIPFYVSDDLHSDGATVQRLSLRVKINNLVRDDRLEYSLNGQSLADEERTLIFGEQVDPYQSMWVTFNLHQVMPKKGWNELGATLLGRAEGLQGKLVIEDVEMTVEYGPYPATP